MKIYSLTYAERNTFSIVQYVIIAMREQGKSEKEIIQYHNEALSGDFDTTINVSENMICQLNKNIKAT